MTECIYCRTTCNEGESPCQSYDAAEQCAWFTESDRRALRVSDEQPKAENPKGLSPKGASAAASAETPHPSPVDYTEVVERLREYASEMQQSYTSEICLDAAQVIEAQAAENERLKKWREEYLAEPCLCQWQARAEAAKSRLADAVKAVPNLWLFAEHRERLEILGDSEVGAGLSANDRAAINQALWLIDECAKVCSFLSTGGDSHG